MKVVEPKKVETPIHSEDTRTEETKDSPVKEKTLSKLVKSEKPAPQVKEQSLATKPKVVQD